MRINKTQQSFGIFTPKQQQLVRAFLINDVDRNFDFQKIFDRIERNSQKYRIEADYSYSFPKIDVIPLGKDGKKFSVAASTTKACLKKLDRILLWEQRSKAIKEFVNKLKMDYESRDGQSPLKQIYGAVKTRVIKGQKGVREPKSILEMSFDELPVYKASVAGAEPPIRLDRMLDEKNRLKICPLKTVPESISDDIPPIKLPSFDK